MSDAKKTLEFKFERTIPAPVAGVFDGWLDPKIPGNPWNMAEKLLLNPKVDGFFYWIVRGNSHYGRFTEMQRPHRMQHTWMSRSTAGEETMVTLTFKQQGENTLMTLVHTGIPDTDAGKGHEKGWNYFLDLFPKHFAGVSEKKA